MQAYSTELGYESTYIAETVALEKDLFDGWNRMAGIMTVTEAKILHDWIYVRVLGPGPGMNVFYDEISIVPMPRSCGNLVLNGNFEGGDSRFWKKSWIGVGIDISAVGANGSNYSMMVQKYTGHGMFQQLDNRCISEGQEFLITAKFKYLNTTDMVSGVDCKPTILNVGDPSHCPYVTVRGERCTGSNIEYTFWNEINQFVWNPDEFNPFEKIFPVGAEIASCKVSVLNISPAITNKVFLLTTFSF